MIHVKDYYQEGDNIKLADALSRFMPLQSDAMAGTHGILVDAVHTNINALLLAYISLIKDAQAYHTDPLDVNCNQWD